MIKSAICFSILFLVGCKSDTQLLIERLPGYYENSIKIGHAQFDEMEVQNAKMDQLLIVASSGRFQHRGRLYSTNRFGDLEIGRGRTVGRWELTDSSRNLFTFNVEQSTWEKYDMYDRYEPPTPNRNAIGKKITAILQEDGDLRYGDAVYAQRRRGGSSTGSNTRALEDDVIK